LTADTGSPGELAPPSVLPLVEGEAIDALAEGEEFSEADHVEGDGCGEFEEEFGVEGGVFGRPVGGTVVVEQQLRTELGGGEAGMAGGGFGLLACEIAGEGLVEDTAKLAESGDVVGVDLAAAVRGDVQVEAAAASDGGVINLEQIGERFDAVVFGGVVEPPGADGHIAFGGDPMSAGAFALVEAFGASAGVAAFGVEGGPAGIAGEAAFVTHPTEVGSGIAEHDGHGLEFAHDVPGGWPIVIGAVVDAALLPRASVEAVATVGAVEPDGEEGAVLGEEFAELVAVVDEVFGSAVIGVVTIPGGEVDAELEALSAAGVGEFAHDIAVAFAPGAGLDGMGGVGAGPEAESVVVFGGEDETGHAGHFGGAGDLVGVEVGGVENRGAFVAVAPFTVGEGIHREVNEAVEFHGMPGELPGGGEGSVRCRRFGGQALGGGQQRGDDRCEDEAQAMGWRR